MRGFTLIEMIVVIALTAIIAAVVARNIARPIQGFVDTARRAALADAADTAATRLIRETRLALPNSVRVGGGATALEFLRTRTGGRYRAQVDPSPPPGLSSDALEFVVPDTSFDVLGELRNFGQICETTPSNCGFNPGTDTVSTNLCMTSNVIDCLVVFNTGQPACTVTGVFRTNAYCGDNVAGINDIDVANRTISFVHDLGGFQLPSPNQRFHIVDTPVTYLCDLANNRLLRYDGYAIGSTQPTLAAPPGTTPRVLTDKLVECSFAYDPGNAGRAALLTMRLVVADPDALAERVSLYKTAHVPNTP